MTAIRSKLTAKGQATIPEAVREALKLKTGDVLEFEVEKDAVRLRKVDPEELAWLRLADESFAEEWLSPEDSDAFDDL
jgi:antitoxin PrlF